MARKKIVEAATLLKHFKRMAPHPWVWMQSLKLEAGKRFFEQFYPHAENGQAGKIRQMSIRITDICNLRCHTCGQWGDRGFLHDQNLKDLKKGEVSPERYLEIFSELAAGGHRPFVYFWGGEPMLYDGILELIEGASRLSLPTAIATNGTNIAKSARRLVQAPMVLLQVSIDGHNEETHNQARPAAGKGNNFRDIMEGLDAVRAIRDKEGQGLPLIASLTTISSKNYRHLVDIYDAFRDRVDQFVFYPSWWITEERAREHDEDFSRRFGFKPEKHWGWVGDWMPDDYEELARQIRELHARSRPLNAPPVSLIPPVTEADELKRYYTDHRATFGFNQCLSIYQALEVNSNGNVSPCRDYHDYVVGNLKEHNVSQIWNNPEYVRFRKSLTSEGLMPVCSRCCGLMGY